MERRSGLYHNGVLLEEYEGEEALLHADCMRQALENLTGKTGYSIKYLGVLK